MATGHPGMATIHAEDFGALIDRLITKPIELPPALLESLDLVLFVGRIKYRGKDVRRIKEVVEIVGLDLETHRPIPNVFVKWNSYKDTFDVLSKKSHTLEKIMENRGISQDELVLELMRKMHVLEYLVEKDIRHYKEVGRYISLYYQDPSTVLSMIIDETKDTERKKKLKELL